MNKPTQQEFQNAFAQSPAPMRDVMLADKTDEAISRLATAYSIKESLPLAATIGYALVGILPMRALVSVLSERTDLSEERASVLAHDIRREIFAPVAKELSAMQPEAERRWQELQNKPRSNPSATSSDAQ